MKKEDSIVKNLLCQAWTRRKPPEKKDGSNSRQQQQLNLTGEKNRANNWKKTNEPKLMVKRWWCSDRDEMVAGREMMRRVDGEAERDRGRWSRWFRGEGVLADDDNLNLKKGDSTGAKLPLWSLLSLLKPLEEEGKAHGTGDTAVEEESSYAWKKKTELSCCFWQREGLQMALIDAAKGGESSSKDGTVTAIKTATMRSMNLSWWWWPEVKGRRWCCWSAFQKSRGDVDDRQKEESRDTVMVTVKRRKRWEEDDFLCSEGERRREGMFTDKGGRKFACKWPWIAWFL